MTKPITKEDVLSSEVIKAMDKVSKTAKIALKALNDHQEADEELKVLLNETK
jgi:hypothetical protein